MLALSGVLGFTLFAFWVFTIFDVAITNKGEIRRYNKPIWFLILVLGMTLGSISWYLVGRPKKSRTAPATTASDAPDSEFSDSPAPESSDAAGFKLPSREDLFGIDANRPRGPEDDEAWLANVTVGPAPVIDDQPGATLDPEAAIDFAEWEADFETGQDSGTNA